MVSNYIVSLMNVRCRLDARRRSSMPTVCCVPSWNSWPLGRVAAAFNRWELMSLDPRKRRQGLVEVNFTTEVVFANCFMRILNIKRCELLMFSNFQVIIFSFYQLSSPEATVINQSDFEQTCSLWRFDLARVPLADSPCS